MEPLKKYSVLKGIEHGNRFYVASGSDTRATIVTLFNGVKAYELMATYDTMAECQKHLYGSTSLARGVAEHESYDEEVPHMDISDLRRAVEICHYEARNASGTNQTIQAERLRQRAKWLEEQLARRIQTSG